MSVHNTPMVLSAGLICLTTLGVFLSIAGVGGGEEVDRSLHAPKKTQTKESERKLDNTKKYSKYRVLLELEPKQKLNPDEAVESLTNMCVLVKDSGAVKRIVIVGVSAEVSLPDGTTVFVVKDKEDATQKIPTGP